MSVNLESVLNSIQGEKDTKLIPNNLRYGINCMGVQGALKPVTIDGADVGKAIYLQDTTPTDPCGIWINTDKTCDDIYIEDEQMVMSSSPAYSNRATEDTSNFLANHANPTDFIGSTYAQKGNIIHMFGYCWNYSTYNTTTKIHQHYKYNFSTNTWTKMSDCPTPQGGCQAVWIGDYIYIFGTAYNTNTDYNLYAYKYDTVNDTWTRLADMPTSTYFTIANMNKYGTGCVYDNDHFIYIGCYNALIRYNINNDTYETLTYTGDTNYYMGYNLIMYYDNTVFAFRDHYRFKRYNASSNSWSTYSCSSSTSASMAYPFASVMLINDTVYLFQNATLTSTNKMLLPTNASSIGSNAYRPANILYANLSTKITSSFVKSNTLASEVNSMYVPIAHFVTSTGEDVIVQFGGVVNDASYGFNALSQMGFRLEDKTYDFENNTLIIYSTKCVTGAYTTCIYRDNDVIHGKLYQQFGDVNLWDASQQKLIKNLTTYYGNDTDWIQIK